MRYNLIIWNIITTPYPTLECDTWQETKKEALELMKKHTTEGKRGIVIDWKTTKVILELQSNKIKMYV